MKSYNDLFNPANKPLTETEETEIVQKGIRFDNHKIHAKNKAEEDFYLKKERLLIKLRLNTNIPEWEYEEMDRLLATQKEQNKQNDPNYAVFITINPKANLITDFKALDDKVKKCISKYWVTDYCYCYEQRSDDEKNIHGLHAHILLTRNLKPSHTKREVQSTFKAIVGIPDKHINIQYKKKDWIPDKLEYMLGKKSGDGKDSKQIIDKIMRKTLGIENYYSNEKCGYFI